MGRLESNASGFASGSFKVHLITGHWADFATGDKGGDLVSLYAYLHRLKNGQAARELADQLGIADRAPSAKPCPTVEDWLSLVPIPAEAPPPPTAHPTLGPPFRHWCYRDEHGQVLLYVYRFEVLKDGQPVKEFRPLTCWRKITTGEITWRWKELSKPWPLYNLDQLVAHPTATAVTCEGEKAADAAALLFPLPAYVTTTSLHGSQAPKNSDCSPSRAAHHRMAG